jgi:integrase
VLFHRGQLTTQPRKLMASYADRPPVPARMQATVDRWLAVRRLTDRPATVAKLKLALRRFMVWLTQTDPALESFAAVTRDHALEYLTAMAEDPTPQTGRPLSALSRIGRTSALSMFFRDTAAWQWPDVPGHALLGAGDRPRAPTRVPRFIPADELEPLITAIADLECPQQRAALLVARWCGARQGEIRRLAIDCLDRYPDATPRLRLPAGKTYRERMVPLHEQAAEALREVIALRHAGGERAFTDELTGHDTHYLFMRHGKLLSFAYLFRAPLARACAQANLIDDAGRPTVSSHRFLPHRRHAARRARRPAADDHERARSPQRLDVARLRPDQRPRGTARLPDGAGPRRHDRRPVRRCPEGRRAPQLRDRLAEDQLLQDRTRASTSPSRCRSPPPSATSHAFRRPTSSCATSA